MAFSLVAISDQSFKKNFFIGTTIAFEMHGQVDIDSNSEVKREFLILFARKAENVDVLEIKRVFIFLISRRDSRILLIRELEVDWNF